MPPDESRFLQEFEMEVEAELGVAQSSGPAEELLVSPAEWLYDPTDVQREQVGLANLLGAAGVLGEEPRADITPVPE
jgi:hypothetical protein